MTADRTPPRLRIAIDGPAASGKGTVARGLAAALGYTYVDTGTLYRTLALLARREGVSLSDEASLAQLAATLPVRLLWDGHRLQVLLGEENISEAIRTEEAGQDASAVAALPRVRAALLGLQQRLGAAGGVVMDGRDIGSVVMPGAELKVYLDASLAERARRRLLELRARGLEAESETILREVAARDAQDSQRAVAPLQVLPDSWRLDTTGMSPAEVLACVVAEARRRGA
ncbi:MAG: (d)CMP kinase [Pseudomonadota bacterium]